MMPRRLLVVGPFVAAAAAAATTSAPWYDGIESVKVVSPSDNVGSIVQNIYQEMKEWQFSPKRYAVLLKSGNYGALEIPLGFYTSIIGVGSTRSDVTVKTFYSVDTVDGVATHNFWRSVEGLTTTAGVTWATSQACPLRRLTVQGDLWLSQTGAGKHYTSGGFMGDTNVWGKAYVGTQQQYFFRNSRAGGGFGYQSGVWNFVFVGSDNAPETSDTGKDGQVSFAPTAPRIAEKPFLVERDGEWSIRVPPVRYEAVGIADESQGTNIPMSDVFVALPSMSSSQINSGILGKKALLLTPGIYSLQQPLQIGQSNFVVLGIGFPTLVPSPGVSALVVGGTGVRVAGILAEAPAALASGASEPIIVWQGPSGVGNDIFTRLGAFSYSTSLKPSCAITKANVHVQVDGQGVTLDNTWFWHADHDDCGLASDRCYSGNGLVVHGDNVMIYGLKVEHMMSNMVEWYGEDGKVFFYQAELPYHDYTFGSSGYVGYKVDYAVRKHSAMGLGIYIIGGLQMPTAFRVPAWANMKNMVVWVIGGAVSQFASMVCTEPGTAKCLQGDQCFGSSACYRLALPYVPPPPAPAPAPTPAPSPAPAPGPTPAGWTHYAGYNCFPGYGAVVAGAKEPAESVATLEACQADCIQAGPSCTGVVMPQWESPGQCFLRGSLVLEECMHGTAYDLWTRPAADLKAVVV